MSEEQLLTPFEADPRACDPPRVGVRVHPAPRVSVIVPAYNVAAYIAETLDSILAQTFVEYEIIVINDGSPDTSELERVLTPYFDCIVYVTQANRGLSGARNTGIRVARGELIALLDGDDLWERDYLAVQVAALDADPTASVVYPNGIFFGETILAGREFMAEHPSHGEVTFAAVCRRECNVLVSATMRRSVVIKVGMFDEDLRRCEDYDLWLRILKSGARIAYHRRPLIRYRRRDDSLSANWSSMLDTRLSVLAKIETQFDLTPDERAAVSDARAHINAARDLAEARQAFFTGQTSEAVTRLNAANKFYRSRKIAAVVKLLPFAHPVLLKAYKLRDTLIFKTDTSSRL